MASSKDIEQRLVAALQQLRWARGMRLRAQAKVHRVEQRADRIRLSCERSIAEAKEELRLINCDLSLKAAEWDKLAGEVGQLHFEDPEDPEEDESRFDFN